MTTAIDQRESLAQLAQERGWQRNTRERVDVYIRGLYHVHLIWNGNGEISGASHHEDSVLIAYTRDLGKAQTWLGR